VTVSEQKRMAKELLAPTRIYAAEVMALTKQDAKKKISLHGIAHITGGAYFDKLTKILPKGKCFEVQKGSWPVLEIFKKIQGHGSVAESEMYRPFNMGIGLVIVVSAKDADQVQKILKKQGSESYLIGKVIEHQKKKIVFC